MAFFKYINRILIIFLLTISLFSCAKVDLARLPLIPPMSNMKAKTNLDLQIDSVEFRGSVVRGAAFRAEPIMIRHIYNKNFFNSVLASNEKGKADDSGTLRMKIIATPKENHKFNWLITWPAIYPCIGYWPIQHKTGEVGVNLKCEVYDNDGELLARIDEEHTEKYEVQIYGFYTNGDAETKLRKCYNTVFAAMADKIVNNRKVIALGRSGSKTKYATLKKKRRKPSKKRRYQPAEIVEEDAVPRDINFGKYHALVIGINDYQHMPKLKTAVNDARSIAGILEKNYGFDVQLLVNPGRTEIISRLSKLRRTMTRNDNLLIYYAGHGWLDKQAEEGYWLPVDAEQDNEANWVSNSTITANIRALSAKHIMIIADSCYSGKLTRGLHIKRKTPNYLTRMAQKKTRVVLASGGLEPVEDSGGKGNHSIFASALIETLEDNRSVLDGTELFSKIKRPVLVNTDQTPEYGDIRKTGHDGGDFLFVFTP